MTKTQFYKELRKLRGKFHLTRGGAIRTSHMQCPIEAVAHKGPGDLPKARDKLKLWGEGWSGEVVRAADYPADSMFAAYHGVRRLLLKTVGLRERRART